MNEKLEKISEIIKEAIKFSFNLLIAFINAGITMTLVAGSIVSFILLSKLYPEIFVTIIEAWKPIANLFIDILIIIFWATYWLLVAWMISIIIKSSYYLIKNRKKKIEINKEKFLDDLAKKMNKRLKKTK